MQELSAHTHRELGLAEERLAYELLVKRRGVGVAFEVEVRDEPAHLFELHAGDLLQVEDLPSNNSVSCIRTFEEKS